jgi:hypothetical protein
MANISDFKAQLTGGGARANQFRVGLAFPSFVNLGVIAGTQAQFLCNTAQLPASTIEPISVLYRGRPVNFAGERTFAPWTVSIYNDTNFNIRNALEQWSNGIQNNADTNGITNPLNYQVDMAVYQLDRNGATIKTYSFHDAFPSEVGDIQLGYDQGNAIETFNVTFQYNFWTSDTSTGGAAGGFGVSGTVNTPVGSFPI